MFLCSRGKRLTQTSYLMFFCPYALMSPALAANTNVISYVLMSALKNAHSSTNCDFWSSSNKPYAPLSVLTIQTGKQDCIIKTLQTY